MIYISLEPTHKQFIVVRWTVAVKLLKTSVTLALLSVTQLLAKYSHFRLTLIPRPDSTTNSCGRTSPVPILSPSRMISMEPQAHLFSGPLWILLRLSIHSTSTGHSIFTVATTLNRSSSGTERRRTFCRTTSTISSSLTLSFPSPTPGHNQVSLVALETYMMLPWQPERCSNKCSPLFSSLARLPRVYGAGGLYRSLSTVPRSRPHLR